MKELAAYDFDSTLFKSPTPETGKILWKEKTKTDWPYIGWWSKAESLDLNVFDIKPNQEIIDHYFIDKNKGIDIILLTSRLRQLANSVLAVCNKYDVTFKHAYFKHLNLEKPDILHKIAIDGNYDVVYFYDDRQKEIDLMINHLKKDLPYILYVYHVDDKTGKIKNVLTNDKN